MSSLRYDATPAEERIKVPILTAIYRGFGALWLLVAGVAIPVTLRGPEMLAGGLATIAVAVFIALVCFGIAEVVMLVAKIEHNTRATDTSYEMVKLLAEIAKNTTPAKAVSINKTER